MHKIITTIAIIAIAVKLKKVAKRTILLSRGLCHRAPLATQSHKMEVKIMT